MNALDGALAQLLEAQNYLEKERPTVQEVEKAKDAAKSAADILKAAHTLMEMDFYQVAKPQVDRYNDPAQHHIRMPEIRHEVVLEQPAAPAPAEPAPLPPMPDLFLAGFQESHPEAQKVAFESALEDLDGAGLEAMPDNSEDWDDSAWWAEFDKDRALAWQKLMFATHHRQPFAFTVPIDEEFATWVAQHAAPEKADCPTCDCCGQTAVHDEDCAFSGPVGEAQDEEAAALAEDVHTDSPAEELARFNQQLHQLEETGVKESKFKRKGWAKAEQCWRAAFAADPALALAKVTWVLGRNVVGWDVPTDEEIQPAEPAGDDDPFETKEGGDL